MGTYPYFGDRFSERALETAAGQIKTARGIGEPLVTKFISISSFDPKVVEQQIANLKASCVSREIATTLHSEQRTGNRTAQAPKPDGREPPRRLEHS